MNSNVNTESQFNAQHTLEPMLATAESVNHVLTNVAKDMWAHHTEAGTAFVAEALTSIVPAFAPGGTSYWFQQIPAVFQSQFQRHLQSIADSIGILSRAQLQLLALGGHSLPQHNGQTGETLSESNAALANRRVSATVINFPDRRARAQVEPQLAQPTVVAGQDKKSLRSRRGAA